MEIIVPPVAKPYDLFKFYRLGLRIRYVVVAVSLLWAFVVWAREIITFNIAGVLMLGLVELAANLYYQWRLPRVNEEQLRRRILTDEILDVFVITGVAHYFGGIEAIGIVIAYVLLIVFTGLFLSKFECFLIANVSLVSYTALVGAEYYGLIPHLAREGLGPISPNNQVAFLAAYWLFMNAVAHVTALSAEQRRKQAEQLRVQNEALAAHAHEMAEAKKQVEAYARKTDEVNDELERKNREAERTLRKLKKTQLGLRSAENELSIVKRGIKTDYDLSLIVGQSEPMQRVFDLIQKAVNTNATVMILGETGTGKELVAKAIHFNSDRKNRAFLPLNCSAVPETLLESELFGYRKGAFTGADRDKKGLFEMADKGTIFLDEIGDMPLSLQPKLLRVLEKGEVTPIGTTESIHVDVRLISATNQNLERDVDESNFRKDLYYRLNVFPIQLPPLRDRREDIPILVKHFLTIFNTREGKRVSSISTEAMSLLENYGWPGNVRELEHEIHRLVAIVGEDETIAMEMLSEKITKSPSVPTLPQVKDCILTEALGRVERWMIEEALKECGGSRTEAARRLGITRVGLYKKMNKLNIQ